MNKPVKFLIIRFSSIGDIVLTTPVIRCLKQQYPYAEVHFVVKKKFKSVVEHNPYIDHLHLLDDNLSDLVRTFKAERFDYIIDLHKTLRSYLLRLRLWRPTLSFRKLSVEKFLMNRLHIDLLPRDLHIVDRNLQSIEKLGVYDDGKPVDYFLSKEDQVDLDLLPLSHRKGYVAFVIGGQHFTKRLPTTKIIGICRKMDLPVLLLGGPEDAQAGTEIEMALGAKVYNACGKFSLNQSVSLLASSKAVIAHDTGLMHISGAFNKPVISVWGGTSPEHFGVWPYLNEQNVIAKVPGLPCQPCSNFGLNACPEKHFKCMLDQDEDFIAKTATGMFDETSLT